VSLAEELARAQTFTGANGAALATLEGDKLVWLGAVGENPPKAGDRWSLAGSFATLCLGRKTRPQRCDDVEADGRVDSSFRGLHAKSLALAPVHDAGKVTGILAVFSDNSRAFNGMHAAVLQTEADNLAELVQIARRAAGIKEDEKKPEVPEPARPVAESATQAMNPPAVSAPPETKPGPLPTQEALQQDFEAFESAFVVIPPPVAGPPSAPAAEAPPVLPAAQTAAAPAVSLSGSSALPRLTVVPTPAPHPAAAEIPERPTLPGFMPLSATAAALAKAKPVPPTPPELVVEKKSPKLLAASPQPAVEVKKPMLPQPLVAAPAPVPTPPPATTTAVVRVSAPAAVPTPRPAPAPLAATPRSSASPPKPANPPAARFVPLAKPGVKTPPPGSLKAAVPGAPASTVAAKAAPSTSKESAEPLLPAAADPFAGFDPAYQRAHPRLDGVASHATLAGLEEVGRAARSGSIWKLPLVVAALAAVALGGLWLKTRRHVPVAKAAPAVTQPAPTPAPAATNEVAATTPMAESPAPGASVPVAANPAPATGPANKPSSVPEKPAPEKTAPSVKTQPAAVATAPVTPKPPAAAAAVSTPSNLEVKASAPLSVPVMARQQEPPPKTMLSVPVAAPAKMPDLPKPEAPATEILRRASTPVAAQLLESVSPSYPMAAKAMHQQGVVRLSAKVSPQGRVTEVNWVSGNALFRDSAMTAVRQWRYKPASLDGQPVESTVEIVLKFAPQ
jgi:TonB family protein